MNVWIDRRGRARINAGPNGSTMPFGAYVIERATGQSAKGKVVHHLNGNPLDNRLENLLVVATNREHRQLHIDLKITSRGGDPKVHGFCSKCGVVKDRAGFHPDYRRAGRLCSWCVQCKSEWGKNYKRKQTQQLRESRRE
jgi:hypothetical protein